MWAALFNEYNLTSKHKELLDTLQQMKEKLPAMFLKSVPLLHKCQVIQFEQFILKSSKESGTFQYWYVFLHLV